jgi:Tol biopolymer transport system component
MKKQLLLLAVLLLALALSNGRVRSQSGGQPEPPPWSQRLPETGVVPYWEGDRPEPEGRQPATINRVIPWSRAVFQSYRDYNWEIYAGNDDGSEQVRLTLHAATEIHPRFNRGASQVVFASNRTGTHEIYTMNADGSAVTRLTFTGSQNGNPAWSPDGSRIVFESYRDGQAEVYVMNADGSNQQRLTAGGAFNGMPAWSPDGSKIAFSSRRTGDYRIWVMAADGSGQTQLSHLPSSTYPAWSPDGRKIAFSADQLGTGWLGIHTINADGSGEMRVVHASYHEDALVRSWSPDGRYVTYTRIRFTNYQGNWYWVEAFPEAIDPVLQGNIFRLSTSGLDWHLDWQTVDATAPTSSIAPLPVSSASPIAVHWSGSDAGGSGLKEFDVQVKVGSGSWSNWLLGTTQTSALYPATGGQQVAFRVRGHDHAYNVPEWASVAQRATTVEALPPKTSLTTLAPYTRADSRIAVSWGGFDPGGSGIASYDLQYRLNNGPWTNWLLDSTLTGALLEIAGLAGDTVGLRVRARDHAQNLESWPTSPSGTTRLYLWGISGTVHDNTGTPVGGALAQTWPLPLNADSSGREGGFATYVAADSHVYSHTLAKAGYGELPATFYPAGPDARLNGALPPADNLVANAYFETGSLSPDWLAAGTRPPIITGFGHTGEHGVLAGEWTYELQPSFSAAPGNAHGSAQILTGQNGAIHLLWHSHAGGYATVWHRHRSGNGLWSSPVSVATNASLFVVNAVIDKDGNLHAVWNESGNEYDVYYARWQHTTNSWSAPVNISKDSNWSYLPRLVMDVDGRIIVVWQSSPPGSSARSIRYALRHPNGIWTSPVGINDNFGHPYHVEIGTDDKGITHLLWLSRNIMHETKIRYTRQNRGGTWDEAMDLTGGFQGSTLLFQVEGNGTLHMAWSEIHDLEYHLVYRRRDEAGSWSIPWRPLPDWFAVSRMVVGPDGLAHFVGRRLGQIYHIQQQPGGNWHGAQLIGNAPTYPELVVDAAGKAHVIWSGSDSGGYSGDVYYTRQKVDGNGWTAPVNLSPGSDDPRAATIAADSAGYAHIAWVEGSFPTTAVRYRGSQLSAVQQDSHLQTVVTIPFEMASPILSYQYYTGGLLTGGASTVKVTVENGAAATVVKVHNQSSTGWQHGWADLSAWQGQTVTVTFSLLQAANTPMAWFFLDSVTVGSTQPDVWVTVSNTDALPGEQFVQQLAYGNRGGAVAQGTLLTYTLPAQLSYVTANPLPVSTLPLVWDLAALPAKSNPFTIVLTGQVAANATPFTAYSGTAVIGTATNELERLNNSSQGQVYTARYLYLPLITR